MLNSDLSGVFRVQFFAFVKTKQHCAIYEAHKVGKWGSWLP